MKVKANIEGMMCGMCEAHMNDAIRRVFPDAKKVKSSHKKNETTFVLDGELDEEYLSIKQYKAATKKLGNLEYDECFGYVPLLALGGKESVNNLKKVKILEHIALIAEMTGEV